MDENYTDGKGVYWRNARMKVLQFAPWVLVRGTNSRLSRKVVQKFQLAVELDVLFE